MEEILEREDLKQEDIQFFICSKTNPNATKEKKKILQWICAHLNSHKEREIIINFERDFDSSMIVLSDWIYKAFKITLKELDSTKEESSKFLCYSKISEKQIKITIPKIRKALFLSHFSIDIRSGSRSQVMDENYWLEEIQRIEIPKWNKKIVTNSEEAFRQLKAGNKVDIEEGTLNEFKSYEIVENCEALKTRLESVIPAFLNSPTPSTFHLGISDDKTIIGITFKNWELSLQDQMTEFGKTLNKFLRGSFFPPVPSHSVTIKWTKVFLPTPLFFQEVKKENIDDLQNFIRIHLKKNPCDSIFWKGREENTILIGKLKEHDNTIDSSSIDLSEYNSANRYVITVMINIPESFPRIFARETQVQSHILNANNEIITLSPFNIWLYLKKKKLTIEMLYNEMFERILITLRVDEAKKFFSNVKFDVILSPSSITFQDILTRKGFKLLLVLDIQGKEQASAIVEIYKSFSHHQNIKLFLYAHDKAAEDTILSIAKEFETIEDIITPKDLNESKISLSYLTNHGTRVTDGLIFFSEEKLKEIACEYLKGYSPNNNSIWWTFFASNIAVERRQTPVIVEAVRKLFKTPGIHLIKIFKPFRGSGASTLVRHVAYLLREECYAFILKQKIHPSELEQSDKPYLLIADDDITIPLLGFIPPPQTTLIVLLVTQEFSSNDLIVDPYLQSDFENFLVVYKKYFPKSGFALNELQNVVNSQDSHKYERHIFTLILTAVRGEFKPIESYVGECLAVLKDQDKSKVQCLAFLAVFGSGKYCGLKLKEKIECELLIEKQGITSFWHVWLAHNVLKGLYLLNDYTVCLKIFKQTLNFLFHESNIDSESKVGYLSSLLLERSSFDKNHSRLVGGFSHLSKQELQYFLESLYNESISFFLPGFEEKEKKKFQAHWKLYQSRLDRQNNNHNSSVKKAREALDLANRSMNLNMLF